MLYIDQAYYDDDYQGVPVYSGQDINRLIKRASETIDKLTGYKLVKNEVVLADTHIFIQDMIKRATAKMVEFYIINGGYEAVNEINASSVGLGSFNYSVDVKGNEMSIPSDVIDCLSQTGLMFAGINTAGGGVYFES